MAGQSKNARVPKVAKGKDHLNVGTTPDMVIKNLDQPKIINHRGFDFALNCIAKDETHCYFTHTDNVKSSLMDQWRFNDKTTINEDEI
jgi:hypothetical protein